MGDHLREPLPTLDGARLAGGFAAALRLASACSVALLLAAALPQAAAALPGVDSSARYTITEIDMPAGVAAGPIAGVNAAGDVAGVGYETSNDDPDCLYYDGATLQDFNFESGNWCHFTGLTARGVAVGQYYDFGNYANYAVLYAQGQFTEVDHTVIDSLLDVGAGGLAVGNLPAGIFGAYKVTTGKVAYALYDAKEKCRISFPYAVNSHGVVLAYDQCRNGRTRYETVANDVFTYFQPPHGFVVVDQGVRPVFNGLGQIVIHKTGSGHAYLWSTSGGGPLDLGTLAEDPNGTYEATGLTDTLAIGITSDGYSWLWTAKEGMRNLAALLPENSYGWIQPQSVDAEGDLGCITSASASTWLYLRRR